MPRRGNIGLVAIGRNEGERLRLCLGSVPGDMPIAYIDSASTDGSAELARSMGAVVVELGGGGMRSPPRALPRAQLLQPDVR